MDLHRLPCAYHSTPYPYTMERQDELVKQKEWGSRVRLGLITNNYRTDPYNFVRPGKMDPVPGPVLVFQLLV